MIGVPPMKTMDCYRFYTINILKLSGAEKKQNLSEIQNSPYESCGCRKFFWGPMKKKRHTARFCLW